MLANYGYSDGTGSYYITIDTDRCNGCGDCASACPAGLFEVLDEDPNDPMREDPVAVIKRGEKKKMKYECNPCKPAKESPPLPCVEACQPKASSHSW